MAYWLTDGNIENEMKTEEIRKGKCLFCNTFYTYKHIRETNWDGSHDSDDWLIESCTCKRDVGYYGDDEIEVDLLKVKELKEFLKYHKVKGYSKLNKKQLINLVETILADIEKKRFRISDYIK